MLRLNNITKKYNNNNIFDEYSYSFDSAGFYVITGPSGTGKTTLLNIIGLNEEIDSGQVIINDKVAPQPYSKAARKYYSDYYAYIFQDYLLVEHKTVLYNLEMLGYSQEKILEALNDVGLGEKIKQVVYQLSGGEKQRVAVARAILKQPKVLLADEPTAALDKENVKIVMQLLRKINSKGITVIMVTHDQSIISESDTIIMLN